MPSIYSKLYYEKNKEKLREHCRICYHYRKIIFKNIKSKYNEQIINDRYNKIKEFIDNNDIERILKIVNNRPIFLKINKPITLTFD